MGLAIQSGVVCALALSYWTLINHLGRVQEPWDARLYWSLAYPGALLAAGISGWLMKRHGWLSGLIIMFMQMPVMWLAVENHVNWSVGMLFLTALAVPAIIIASACGYSARRSIDARRG